MKLKRIIALAIALILAALSLAACAADTAEQEDNFAAENDPLLTLEEILEYAYLEIPEYITIRGEQFSTELTELVLNEMNLTDEEIVPLRYMIHLTNLELFHNQISDLTPLAGMTNLTSNYACFVGNSE